MLAVLSKGALGEKAQSSEARHVGHPLAKTYLYPESTLAAHSAFVQFVER